MLEGWMPEPVLVRYKNLNHMPAPIVNLSLVSAEWKFQFHSDLSPLEARNIWAPLFKANHIVS